MRDLMCSDFFRFNVFFLLIIYFFFFFKKKKKHFPKKLFPRSFLHIFGHIFFIHLVVRNRCKAVLQLPGSDYDDNAAI